MVRGSWTWCLALALLLVVPLGGACKKKGLRPGEGAAGGAGGGIGEEGLGGSSLERAQPVIAPGAVLVAAFLEVAAEPLDLALHLLQLPAVLLNERAQLAVLLHEVRVRRAAGERRQQNETPVTQTARHGPRTTACTRRLRAQQVSFSSWQSGSSLP